MAISTKPGGKYDTENGQYVSDGSSDAGQSKKQEPTKTQRLGEAFKQYQNKRLNIPLDYFGAKNNSSSTPSEKKIPSLPSEAFGFEKEFLKRPDHLDHMRNMGFDNPKEYEKSAIRFWNNGDGEVFYSHARKRFHKYSEKEGIMLVISPDGTIHTFYQVKPKKFKAIMLQERLEKWKK